MAVTISETLTDNQLLEKIGQGDQLSFETLFRRHYGRVYGLIFRLVGDPQEAEDIAQEVFIRLYQRPPRRRQTHNVAAWLYRVATNRAYNAIRGRKRLWQRNTLLVKSESEGDPGPEPELLAKEERARVTAALLQLKPQQVQLLLLRQMGLSYAELAESCHIRPNSVGKTLERAANAFRKAYTAMGTKVMNRDDFNDVLQTLSTLEPDATEAAPPLEHALVRLKGALPAQKPILGQSFVDRFRSVNQFMTIQQRLLRYGAGAALAILIAFFGFSPSGQALAGNFLGIFRVQKFAPISISPERLAELENLDLEGLFPGEFAWQEEPAEPVSVATYADAAEAAGFEAFGANLIDELGAPMEIAVGGGGDGELVVDLDAARSILSIGGVDPSLLPDDLDGAEITVSTEPGIFTHWEESGINLVQMPSPQINYPTGFDPAPVGQAILQFLGMSEAEAASLSNTIDWTNTLLLPIPQGFGAYQEVSINGNPGLLITTDGSGFEAFGEGRGDWEGEAPSGSSLMWEADGMLYMLAGDVDSDILLNLANNN